jgi:hypothetical protein
MKDLNYLNDKRVCIFGDGYLGDEHNGAFRIKIKGEEYAVIASDGKGWEHVSVSHKNKVPSWKTMCIIKDMFFEEEETVIQYHPKKSEYINNHPYYLHLWRPINKEIPTPPKILVGI